MSDRLDSSIFGTDDDVDHVAAPGTGSPPTAPAPTRRSAPSGRGAGRGRRSANRALLLLLVAVIVLGGGYLAIGKLKSFVGGGSEDYPGPGSGQVTIEIAEGATGSAIGETLAKNDVVKSVGAFLAAAADNPSSTGIQPGSYLMKQQMKATDAVAYLVNPANRNVNKVTIPEGRRLTEIFALLSKGTGIPVADYEKAAKNPDSLGLPPDAKGNLEGYLFPATYDFGPKDTAEEQLRAMVGKMLDTTASLDVDSGQMHRILTIASLVEAEGRRPEDLPKISRVIYNRLNTKLKLQFDSTVVYVVGRRGISTTPAERAINSPYNTYVVPGLPAGPISAPGEAAIKAALEPTPGSWIFFVTVNPETGETKFTTTLAEHDAFTKEFQAWCAAHKGVC